MTELDQELRTLREQVFEAYKILIFANPQDEEIYKALEKDHRDKFDKFKKLLQKRLEQI